MPDLDCTTGVEATGVEKSGVGVKIVGLIKEDCGAWANLELVPILKLLRTFNEEEKILEVVFEFTGVLVTGVTETDVSINLNLGIKIKCWNYTDVRSANWVIPIVYVLLGLLLWESMVFRLLLKMADLYVNSSKDEYVFLWVTINLFRQLANFWT